MTLTPEQKDIIDKYVKKPEWRVAGKRADFNAIGERFGVSPVVARVITNRGVTGEKAIAMYLDGGWDSMHDPALMKDMVEAGEIIKEKLSDNRRIRIISDYDVDGVILVYKSCLVSLRYESVSVDVRRIIQNTLEGSKSGSDTDYHNGEHQHQYNLKHRNVKLTPVSWKLGYQLLLSLHRSLLSKIHKKTSLKPGG